MSQQREHPGARRGFSDSTSDSLDIEIDTLAGPGKARRGQARRFGRGAVASVLAGAVAAATMFGFALTARDAGEDLDSDLVSQDIAIPAAAVSAAEQGFASRSESVSRNAVRTGLTGVLATDTAREREDAIEESALQAYDGLASATAEERDSLVAKDMELVKAQEEKLLKEAEEAKARLEAARLLAEQQSSGQTAELSAASAADLAAVSSQGGSMPVKSNYRIGAGYGATGSWSRYHTGQDFPAPTGTPIYAVASGIVLSPTAGSWAGTNVIIQHGNGGATLYAHMSSRVVSPGEAVQAGQLIGYVGNTGRSFGSHLHLEYYAPGVTPGDVYSASNPMSFLRSLGVIN